MSEITAFPSIVEYFFAQRLVAHKQESPSIVTAYCDTFRLLLEYLQKRLRRSPSALVITDLGALVILNFLVQLESDRGNTARSRNARRCAIKSFFHIVGLRDSGKMDPGHRVLAIPSKRTTRSVITYLTREEVDAILAILDQTTWLGSRDHALLLTLYNSGAGASEITGLGRSQIAFDSHTFVHLHRKGREDRTVPLWKQTTQVLQVWFRKAVNRRVHSC